MLLGMVNNWTIPEFKINVLVAQWKPIWQWVKDWFFLIDFAGWTNFGLVNAVIIVYEMWTYKKLHIVSQS